MTLNGSTSSGARERATASANCRCCMKDLAEVDAGCPRSRRSIAAARAERRDRIVRLAARCARRARGRSAACGESGSRPAPPRALRLRLFELAARRSSAIARLRRAMREAGSISRAPPERLRPPRRSRTARAARRRGCWRGRPLRRGARCGADGGRTAAHARPATSARTPASAIRTAVASRPGARQRDCRSSGTRLPMPRPSSTVIDSRRLRRRHRLDAAVRPGDLDRGDRCRAAQAEGQRQLALRAVARSGLHHRPRRRAVVERDADLGADAVAVRLDVPTRAHTERRLLIPAVVAQQPRRAVVRRDEQIEIAVVVVVAVGGAAADDRLLKCRPDAASSPPRTSARRGSGTGAAPARR